MGNGEKNTYVKGQLTAALLELLAEKELRDISVSEIAAAAGVHRVSFYRNFESKEAILRTYTHQLFCGWMEEHGKWEGAPLSELIRAIFTHLEANRDFYGLLHRRGLTCLLKDTILDLCGFDPGGEATAAYASAFAAYSLYGWIEVWFQRGMLEPADEVAALFQDRGL